MRTHTMCAATAGGFHLQRVCNTQDSRTRLTGARARVNYRPESENVGATHVEPKRQAPCASSVTTFEVGPPTLSMCAAGRRFYGHLAKWAKHCATLRSQPAPLLKHSTGADCTHTHASTFGASMKGGALRLCEMFESNSAMPFRRR